MSIAGDDLSRERLPTLPVEPSLPFEPFESVADCVREGLASTLEGDGRFIALHHPHRCISDWRILLSGQVVEFVVPLLDQTEESEVRLDIPSDSIVLPVFAVAPRLLIRKLGDIDVLHLRAVAMRCGVMTAEL